MTTPLEQIIAQRIAASGPITVADFMAEALMHPQHGYYSGQTVFGAAGDFITAPEVSQMFGELLGLCLAQSWLAQGAPGDAIIVELGPGRGTLMADLRRATKGVPGFADLPVHMVEQSSQLRDLQSTAVPGVQHHDTVHSLPSAPIFLIANEFFDALPIRQFQRSATGWVEGMVGLEDGALAVGLVPTPTPPILAARLADTKPGDIVEVCPALPAIVGDLSNRITTYGGAALIIDYGDWRSLGDTLQALRGHAPVPWIDAPGTADITAHVDFEAIARNAAPAAVSAMTPQGVFLERLGITPRAQQLAQHLHGDALDAHIAAHRRLTHPAEMGDLFKVIGLAPQRDQLPPGLATQ